MKMPSETELAVLTRELRSIALAMRAFESAAALAKHMQASNFEQQNPFLYSALMAGLVVTYMRPFKEAGRQRGVTDLPASFVEFDDIRLKDAHREMATARNRLYAHTDATYGWKLRVEAGTSETAFETLISFRRAEPEK